MVGTVVAMRKVEPYGNKTVRRFSDFESSKNKPVHDLLNTGHVVY